MPVSQCLNLIYESLDQLARDSLWQFPCNTSREGSLQTTGAGRQENAPLFFKQSKAFVRRLALYYPKLSQKCNEILRLLWRTKSPRARICQNEGFRTIALHSAFRPSTSAVVLLVPGSRTLTDYRMQIADGF